MTCDEAPDASDGDSGDASGDGAVTRGVSSEKAPRAERVIPASNAWLMTSMMRDVIQEGTGRRARELGRRDIAGKTGTTNEQKDAWFAGFNHAVATAVWVGFDDIEPMGGQETGSKTALPLWKAFMRHELDGIEEETFPQPAGMVTVRIDSETGKVTGSDNPNALFEHFRQDNVPERESESESREDAGGSGDGGDGEDRSGSEPIF
jgi:penicillin-binding protein 1A